MCSCRNAASAEIVAVELVCVLYRKLQPSGADVICKKCLVTGRVQGVFYRASAARRAQELSIHGYARNLADGRVEVLACGDEDAVRMFVSWLWTGSSASKVTSVDATDVPLDSVQLSANFSTS
jgi:acylphosphatase